MVERELKKCNRCGYEWLSKVEPKTCARCNSPYWNKPRVRVEKPTKLDMAVVGQISEQLEYYKNLATPSNSNASVKSHKAQGRGGKRKVVSNYGNGKTVG